MAIFYAFCCFAFSAVNDFVFKLFARKERPRGAFIAVIGLVWLGCMWWLPWSEAGDPGATLFWGSVSGLFSVVANVLLIEAMGRTGAGVCATVYRLNLVVVVIGGVLLLGERLTPFQYLGVAFAVLAILTLCPTGRGGRMGGTGFRLAAAAALLRAGMGLSYRYGFLHGADRNGVLLVNSLFWIAGGILYVLLREKKVMLPDRKLFSYGLLSGLLVSGIVFFMALSLQYGEAGIVLPIAQMSFLGTFGLGAVFLKERPGRRGFAAIACGVVAVLLLAA